MNSRWRQLPPHAGLVLIAVSPLAGARSGRPIVEDLTRRLRASGYDVEVSDDIDRISKAAADGVSRGSLRAVVAAGGDGTVALVANRMLPGVPIAVLPLGTENLLAKYLGIKGDPQSVCQMIAAGIALPLDAGKVAERLFLLMVSCGFDADVVRRVHHDRRGHIHHLSYAKPIIDSICNYQYPELRVYCDDRGPITARWGFVFNLPCYAMGLPIAPGAVGTDGLLDVCTFKEGSLWNGLRYLGGVMLGQHQSWDDFATFSGRRLRIESDQQVPYEIDGDPGGFLPIDIEVVPHRVTVVAPMAWVAQQGFQAVSIAR